MRRQLTWFNNGLKRVLATHEPAVVREAVEGVGAAGARGPRVPAVEACGRAGGGRGGGGRGSARGAPVPAAAAAAAAAAAQAGVERDRVTVREVESQDIVRLDLQQESTRAVLVSFEADHTILTG